MSFRVLENPFQSGIAERPSERSPSEDGLTSRSRVFWADVNILNATEDLFDKHRLDDSVAVRYVSGVSGRSVWSVKWIISGVFVTPSLLCCPWTMSHSIIEGMFRVSDVWSSICILNSYYYILFRDVNLGEFFCPITDHYLLVINH